MNYILDTNIVSELIAKQPNQTVIEWIKTLNPENLFLSVITIGEIRKGIAKLPESVRKKNIQDWFNGQLLIDFEERILPINLPVILIMGRIGGKIREKRQKITNFRFLNCSYN